VRTSSKPTLISLVARTIFLLFHFIFETALDALLLRTATPSLHIFFMTWESFAPEVLQSYLRLPAPGSVSKLLARIP
jgi:hypothetical protein